MHALATQSVSSRLRQPERSLPAGRVIHRPKLAIGTGRAVRGYLRWLVAVWVFAMNASQPLPVSETQRHSSQRSFGGASRIRLG
jgi:hypothetical protein